LKVFTYLEIIKGVETGRRYALGEGTNSIGRHENNRIVLHRDERRVSTHHALLRKKNSDVSIEDLQSTNGLFVNEQRVDTSELYPGDTIGLGMQGPLLKLIESETELDAAQVKKAPVSIDVSTRTLDAAIG
jgi:pSer/pThr/pTyr-binding forkhead associated (FHA) protein